jgi:hypothetical protein
MHSRGSASPPLQLALGVLAGVLAAGVATVVTVIHAVPIGGIPLGYAIPALGTLYAAAGLLEILGGTLTITSGATGTRVQAVLPCAS